MPTAPPTAQGARLCGEIAFEMAIPAVWAWHDHTARTPAIVPT